MEENKKCEHHYEPIVEKYQTWEQNYRTVNSTDYTTLNKEKIYIYCRKCWDYILLWKSLWKNTEI